MTSCSSLMFSPTAYHATELACVTPGKTVAVFGAGPVGLLSAYCAILKSAAEMYVVDNIPERLEKAEELGATPWISAQAIPWSRFSSSGRRAREFSKAFALEKKK